MSTNQIRLTHAVDYFIKPVSDVVAKWELFFIEHAVKAMASEAIYMRVAHLPARGAEKIF